MLFVMLEISICEKMGTNYFTLQNKTVVEGYSAAPDEWCVCTQIKILQQ